MNSFDVSAALSADLALAVRDYGAVGRLSRFLMLRQPASASIGLYFAGLACFANGQGDAAIARQLFERALRYAPSLYQQRILLSLAHLDYQDRDYTRWACSCERLSCGDDPYSVLESRRALAIARARDGSHWQALNRLEALYPLVMQSTSLLHTTRMDYLNSLAVELNATGQQDEARKVIHPVKESPFIRSYPEWSETVNEVEQQRKSQVVVQFPAVDRPAQVRRVERILYDESIDGRGLRAYATAGEQTLRQR